MENPVILPANLSSQPVITYSDGIAQLTSAQEKLLAQQFYDRKRVHVEKQFNTGYSGATPYIIAFPESNYNPVVAKFDHPVSLRRERAAYISTVQGKLDSVAPNQDKFKASDDGLSGLLVYSYIGITIEEVQSYGEYVTSGKDEQEIIKVLNRIFLYGLAKVADVKVLDRISRPKYYDRLLPPHLHLTTIDATLSTATVLQAGKLDQIDLSTLTVSEVVQLVGFKVHKRADDGLTLYDDLSPKVDGAPIRLKLKGIQAAPGDELPALFAVITATRSELLDSFARDALSAFPIHSDCFTAYGCTFPNPIRHLQTLLAHRYGAKVAIMHGDLHLENILLDKFSNPWLIDFAKTSEGPILFDLQYLEARILTTLLFDSKASLPKSVKQLSKVLYTLRDEPLPDIDETIKPKTPRGVDHNVYSVLVGLRSLARHYLFNPKEWQEYYRGLTLALLQLLKFEDYPPATRQLALLGAAIVIQWAGIKDVKPVYCPTQPKFLWASTGLLATMLVLSLLGWYRYPNLLRESELPTPAQEATFTPTPIPTTTPIYPLPTKLAADCERGVSEITPITQTIEYTSTLQRVKARGVLLCGVEGALPFFSSGGKNEENGVIIPKVNRDFYSDAVGIDADICRAVATSVFGDYMGRVAFTNLGPSERFPAILNGDIDLLVRNTTWTAWRDISIRDSTRGIDFGPVVFHDGQRFLVHNEAPIRDLADLKGKSVCVQPATTTYTNTLALSNTLGLNLKFPDMSSVRNTQDLIGQFAWGGCDAVAGDTSQLMVRVDGLAATRIIPEYPISYEPLAPAFISGDDQWREIVNYAVWTTIYAEEIGVTQENIDDAQLETSDSVRQRFKDTLMKIGPTLQLGKDYLGNIVRKLGNYGEIYACHFLDTTLKDRGPNQPFIKYDAKTQSWVPNSGGRLFAPPFVPE